jgi:hypothetical protein
VHSASPESGPPRFLNRITGEVSTGFPAEALSGQFLALNGVRLDGGPENRTPRLLVDNGEPETVLDSGASVLRTRLLQGDSASSLRGAVELAENMSELMRGGLSWTDVVELVDPVASRQQVGELLDVAPVEAAAAKDMPHLREACRKPALDLTFGCRSHVRDECRAAPPSS